MLKARNRKLSMILVLAMLMTMFAGLGTASAAIVDYSAYGVTTVNTGTTSDKTLGSILVEIDDVVYLGAYENWVTMKMPAGVSLADADVGIRGLSGSITADADVVNSSTVDIKVQRTADDGTKGKFTIYFEDVKVQSGSGNLDVTFLPQSGSILPGGTVTIANIVSKGATQAMVSSVKSLGEGIGAIDTISIAELSPGVFDGEGTIKLELPAGVEWDKKGGVQGAWAFDSDLSATVSTEIGDDSSILLVKVNGAIDGNGKAGRLDIGGLEIDIDEDDAKKGEIKVKVSSKDFAGVTKQDLVVAKYGDFDVTLAENEVTELTAGKTGQELGSFYIEESLGKSLVAGRTITLSLPSGVKWTEKPELKVEKGAFEVKDESVSSSKVRYTVKNLDNPGAAKVLFEKGEVYVEPNFEGDVELEVTGNAGVNGTVKVSEVVKAVDVSASAVPNIIIGEQNVAAGDIVIKENVAEAIQEGDIVLELAGGYEFYKKPTVKVTDGDLRIDSVDVNSDKQLIITIDKESNDASTITISDVYVTGYRYAPTGPVVAKFVAAKGNDEIGNTHYGSTALDSLYGAPGKTGKDIKFSEKTIGEVTIANCITPAEGAGVAEFRIGSNIYYVGGAAKVMDVAPYIKGDRSYVPMRYVAEMLGAEVVWDDAARTVTLTKGDDIVVFTIGSESYTVNGEAMTADVAPEIANERTMLPARYVAEAFGAVVGWDAGTQTVLVQQ